VTGRCTVTTRVVTTIDFALGIFGFEKKEKLAEGGCEDIMVVDVEESLWEKHFGVVVTPVTHPSQASTVTQRDGCANSRLLQLEHRSSMTPRCICLMLNLLAVPPVPD